ncbi:filamentous haemagglutinin family protein [Cupriavidus basilensis]
MNTCGRSGSDRQTTRAEHRNPRLAPLARAMALTLAAGGVVGSAHAQRAFSPAWFDAKGAAQNTAAATGRLPNGLPASSLTSPLGQQQRANEQLNRSISNLNLAARGIAAQQAAQAAARDAALRAESDVPDGLAEGGLKVDTNSLTAGWLNARPLNKETGQKVVDARTVVSIEQTADKAILNWETFNVGKNTTVAFAQQKDWAVLNKVNDPSARPSQIQGQIKADGTVMIVNRNGIVFSGSSQVDTRNLVAAAARIDDSQFQANGIYASGSTPSFKDALGKIEVQAGATIATRQPASATQGGGYVLLLGAEVRNAGEIATPGGQAALAAGDSFIIRRGVGTDGNQGSTIRGNEVGVGLNAGGTAGKVSNAGLIQAPTGDVTLAGREVVQDGVILSSTSVNNRGTVHLNAVGANGAVTLAQGSTTAIVLDTSGATALDSQRAGLMAPALDAGGNIVLAGNDRRDLSRVEIASTGTVEFQDASLTLATGGQVAVNAARRSLVREGAAIDVSGAVGVKLTMESNNVKINVQGVEQRDAPLNRDRKGLNSNDIWIDRRALVYVPAGTNGYATERWYTGGGLLEVGGYLGTQGHTVGEWMALGGIVNFTGGDVVTQKGSRINLSGGTLDVQSGNLNQSWLKGADGRLYEVSRAPGDMIYTGLYKGFEDVHARWGQGATGYFYSPLIGARQRLENGYTVGRDAGALVIGTRSAVLEGDIVAESFQGARQTQAADASLDGYRQSQNAAARRGQFVVGNYASYYDKTAGALHARLDPGAVKQIVFGDAAPAIAAGFDLGTVMPDARRDTLYLDTTLLNGFRLGAIRVAAAQGITVDKLLQVGAGGDITLYGPGVKVNADLVAHAGGIRLGNVLTQVSTNYLEDTTRIAAPAGTAAAVNVAQGVTLDASGLWSNLLLDPHGTGSVAYKNGGSVAIRSSGSIALDAGSLVDVSSGAVLLANGKQQGGKGGNATLQANPDDAATGGGMALGGALRGYGASGGGTLTVQAGKVLIGRQDSAGEGTLALDGGFFDKGFGQYKIIGNDGIAVADGTQAVVTMPVYRFGDNARGIATGGRMADALEVWTPPLYQEDPAKSVLTQRQGASLSLQAGTIQASAADLKTVQAVVGRGATIQVDPGQSIEVRSIGQLTVDGTLRASGGRISLRTLDLTDGEMDKDNVRAHARSIWIGENAVLDASARAVTATDARGRRYGQVRDGGSIVIGGEIDPALGLASASHNFVVVRNGALIDASGAQAELDIPGLGATRVASNGGSISLASFNGLYLDGTMQARAGGASAAGGSLGVALETPQIFMGNSPFNPLNAADRVRTLRHLVLAGEQGPSLLASGLQPGADDGSLAYGYGRLGADAVVRGGFDNLSVLSSGAIGFEDSMRLAVRQSLQLYGGAMALGAKARDDARVELAAARVLLAGTTPPAAREQMARPVATSAASGVARDSRAVLDVSANLIDIRDSVGLGLKGTIKMEADGEYGIDGSQKLDLRGFGLTTLRSSTDLRFLQGRSPITGIVSTQLLSPGSIVLQAAQVYPATGAGARVAAGMALNGKYNPDHVLRIETGGQGTPAMPYSAFGDLTLGAATIEQAGVLRAPLGHLTLGDSNTSKVVLSPGSETSVSGAGLVMPYGGTVDGLSYLYNGKQVSLVGVGGADSNFGRTLVLGITLGGASVNVQRDAVLDLSGGGELTGAGFVSGRGGSTDARYHPLVRASADGRFSLPGLAANPVYAIVPGVQAAYAPAGGEKGAVDPVIGQRITIGAGVPGLAAGTYTLMPSTYALQKGAYRVELNGAAGLGAPTAAVGLRNGSWSAPAQLSVANTGIGDTLFRQAIVTPADVLRTYSQYNETGYAAYVLADAARIGVPRAMAPVDARTLHLSLGPGAGADALRFDGEARFSTARGGYGGMVAVTNNDGTKSRFEIVAPGGQATAGFQGVTVDAGALNRLGAARIVIGGLQSALYGQGGNVINTSAGALDVTLRRGAVLSAPEVFLSAKEPNNAIAPANIVIEQGAGINTLGKGRASYDAANGFIYANDGNLVAVSNGVLSMLPVGASVATSDNRSLQIGACAAQSCAGQTELYSEGTIALVTPDRFEMSDAVRYGTRNLTLVVRGVNVGDSAALAGAQSRNTLPPGLSLNQGLLDRLLRGDTRYGAPALETLELNASSAVNFFGTAALDTVDPATGKSSLSRLVLGTPAIYGYGGAGDVATIRTGNLVWKGSTQAPATVVTGGAGTGSGALRIEAARIELGYGPGAQPSGMDVDARLVLGFADVSLSATDRLTANNKGSLSVYQAQGAYESGKGYAYTGGNLHIAAPLVTGEAGSVNRIVAGGTLGLMAPAGAAQATAAGAALGAELSLAGRDITVDTMLALPSGKLAISAERDLTLTDRAVLDLAGRKIAFNDVSKYGWGGDVVLESIGGNLRQAAGSVIDISAQHNRAGTLKALALGDGAGVLDLQGKILGGTNGYYDAGGTLLPYKAARVEIRAQRLGDGGSQDASFAALNQRLNDGGVFGARSFQLKQGDLTIGNGVKAGEVNVSLDNGSLTVTGTIDASGERVGQIHLAAKHSLTLAGSALLDAHGKTLRVDSYGKIIDSPNRAMIDLSAGDGQLTLASGARIDLRHGTDAKAGNLPGEHDGRARGTLELNAARTGETSGDIRIDASGNLEIQGARSIAVNGMWRYDDATFVATPAASGRPYQVIDQAYLDGKHLRSTKFIDAALANGNLMNGKLAGLNNAKYADAFHLRPGVEIVSNATTNPGGDMVVAGDLDLSGYRYASVNPHTQKTGVYGSGEVGTLAIRAGGNLDIFGSINDGFAPPPVTQDDKGWLLLPGINFTGGDTVLPRAGVVLADGTSFEGGTTLNYDLPIKARMFGAGTLIPAPSVLADAMVLQPGTVLGADVRDASGALLFAAGSIVGGTSVTLPPGTRMGAGMRLPATAMLAAMTWPKGVALPGAAGRYVLNGAMPLPMGAFLPAATDIKLPDGVTSVELRPAGSGRLWAAAAMLPEGSQSWSVRLVAGADTEAADNRILQTHARQGGLRLADSHYGMFGVPGPTGFVWSQAASDETGIPEIVVGATITDELVRALTSGGLLTAAALCAETPHYCKPKPAYIWTKQGVEEWGDPSDAKVYVGAPLDPVALGWASICTDNPGWCASASTTYDYKPGSTRFSVVRTGAADLDLLAAGDLRMDSMFGVYTAGASSRPASASDPYNLPRVVGANGKVLGDVDGGYEKFVNGGADSLARAWYPASGGNLTIRAGGTLSGDVMRVTNAGPSRPNLADTGYDSAAIGNWLWRQGTGNTFGGAQDQPGAWWINFGTYINAGADKLVGFTGYGTLGGGDLRVDVGGDAGILARRGELLTPLDRNQRSQALVLAVGSTGRVLADGSLSLTGGGDLMLNLGGTLNPFVVTGASNLASDDTDAALNGVIVNLRGDVQLQAAGIGSLPLRYGVYANTQSPRETRAFDPFTATRAAAQGGIVLAPGDASYTLMTRGDLVVKGVNDATRLTMANATPFGTGGDAGKGQSWFSLWTPHTAINLFAAGGDLVPVTSNGTRTDSAVVYPSILSVVAASGSLYYGTAATFNGMTGTESLLLAPSANGKLEFLAGNSIYAGGYTVSASGASGGALATPFRPAFAGTTDAGRAVTNVAGGNDAASGYYPLFAFGANSASGESSGAGEPVRFYAVHGDLVGVDSGRLVRFDASDKTRGGQTWYEGARPVWMMAGRDIVGSGLPLGQFEKVDGEVNTYFTSTGNLFVHNDANDVSVVSAGRDILFGSFNVAGPGTLEVTAGRDIRMEDKAAITSIGAVTPGDKRPGASIALLAGTGAGGPDYAGFASRYLDPARQAVAGQPLAGQAGKVAYGYNRKLTLRDWLRQEYGYTGDDAQAPAYLARLQAARDADASQPRRVLASDFQRAGELHLVNWLQAHHGYDGTGDALAFFNGLAPEQQRVYLRSVYFAELKAGGREYNDANGARYGSYLRGRNAIAALFPANAAAYGGDITMFGAAGVNTLFGGDIAMLTPGGRQVFGTEGEAPKAVSGVIPGVITQGAGDVGLYSQGSILLGQSRIMTTFGGNIMGWSAEGDINAGRGSKTTVVYTPPKRVYDRWGNVTLSSDVPGTGAGIATLAPIPEVPAGDIDLIAPLGTIDAGEAGIRVSGNVNLAALQVVNAANVQVQGKATGVPTIAAVNVGALSNASAVASTAATAAQEAVQRARGEARQNLPSIFTVRVLGFGDERPQDGGTDAPPTPAGRSAGATRYDESKLVQVVGLGANFEPGRLARLTDDERRRLLQDR